MIAAAESPNMLIRKSQATRQAEIQKQTRRSLAKCNALDRESGFPLAREWTMSSRKSARCGALTLSQIIRCTGLKKKCVYQMAPNYKCK
jgi:hypothetical protein